MDQKTAITKIEKLIKEKKESVVELHKDCYKIRSEEDKLTFLVENDLRSCITIKYDVEQFSPEKKTLDNLLKLIK